jgi:hypothetical protein
LYFIEKNLYYIIKYMKTEQIIILVVAFFLGMLLLNMVKNVCGCELKEGFGNYENTSSTFEDPSDATNCGEYISGELCSAGAGEGGIPRRQFDCSPGNDLLNFGTLCSLNMGVSGLHEENNESKFDNLNPFDDRCANYDSLNEWKTDVCGADEPVCDPIYLGPVLQYQNIMSYSDVDKSCDFNLDELGRVCSANQEACRSFLRDGQCQSKPDVGACGTTCPAITSAELCKGADGDCCEWISDEHRTVVSAQMKECPSIFLGPDIGYKNIMTYHDSDNSCTISMTELDSVCSGDQFHNCLSFLESSEPNPIEIDLTIVAADNNPRDCFISKEEMVGGSPEAELARTWRDIQVTQGRNMYGTVPYDADKGFSTIRGRYPGCCVLRAAPVGDGGGLEVVNTTERICGQDSTVSGGGHWLGDTDAQGGVSTAGIDGCSMVEVGTPGTYVVNKLNTSDSTTQHALKTIVKKCESTLPGRSTYRLYISSVDSVDTGVVLRNVYTVYSAPAPENASDDGWNIPPAWQVSQTAFGANIGGVNPTFFESWPNSKYDSWITVGLDNGNPAGELSSIGFNWTEWGESEKLQVTPVSGDEDNGGAVFWLYPDDGPPFKDESGNLNEVLLAQITIPTGNPLDVRMRAQGRTDSWGAGDDSTLDWQAELIWTA